jgi:hypothetical protein
MPAYTISKAPDTRSSASTILRNEAEGEAGEAGDNRDGKGREKKQRQFECRSIHLPAPQQSEQRLNGIAI